MNTNWKVHSHDGWTITAPGGRAWTGAPSQPAALGLANSLAAIDTMLARVVRPALTAVITMPTKARR